MQYRLVIADDHPLFRGALREAAAGLLERVDIAEAGTFDEVVELLASTKLKRRDELPGLSAPGIAVSLLASPATPDDRLAEIGRRSQGFVYAVSVMGTTGERDRLAPSAGALAARVKQVTDLPVLLGFGISTPQQAAEAAAVADGVIVGAAVMRRVLDGAGPAEAGAFVASLRAALSGPVPVR